MKLKNVVWTSLVCFQAFATSKASLELKEVACHLSKAGSVSIRRINEYYVTGVDSNQKASILKVKRGSSSVFVNLEYTPEVLEIDQRRGQLFVSHENKISVYKFSDPQSVQKEWTLDSSESVSLMTFSIMNRKLYAMTKSGNKLWSFDPSKNKKELVYDWEQAQGTAKPQWTSMLVSNDGKRIYWVGKLEGDSKESLGVFYFSDGKIEKKLEIGFNSPTVGISIYKNFFLVIGKNPGETAAYEISTLKPGKVSMPAGWTLTTNGFVLDALDVVLLQGDSENGCLNKFPISIKSNR